MSPIRILIDAGLSDGKQMLAGHWSGSDTFLLVPAKSGNLQHWLENACNLIPQDYRTGCFALLSSGTTGEPKLIVGNKARSAKLACLLHELQLSEPVTEAVCALPLSYSYAFINQWLWSHELQRRLVLTSGFSDPEGLRAVLSRADAAMLCLVGSQVALIRHYFPDAVFPGVIRLHFAGGRFPQEQLPFLRERFPNARIYNNYGCAEAMPRLTLRRAEDAPEASQIGFTLPGVEMKADADRRLLFRSPYRAVAFVDDDGFHPVADEDWMPTGDLGEQLSDGSWRLLGRANEVFKRFGEKISLPMLLTTVKSAWNGDTACYREVDPAGEQGYVLVLSPEPSERQLRDVLMAFRKHHTRPHWPLRIESLALIPQLPNGKPDLLGLKHRDDRQLHWRQRI